MFDAVQPEPVITIAARVGPLDDRAATIIVEALAGDANTLDLGRGKGGTVDIDQRARRHVHVAQRAQYLRAPGFGCLERHGVAHDLARIHLTPPARPDARERAFDRHRPRTPIATVVPARG